MGYPVNKALFCIVVIILSLVATGVKGMAGSIRKSVIAGTWYPGDAVALRADIKRYISDVDGDGIGGTLVGMVVPHAGYMYSGPVAAYAYRMLEEGDFDSIVIIGPSHRVAFKGVSVYDGDGYETPLGVVPVDRELRDALLAHDSVVSTVAGAHRQEHSVEIQLPFLQARLGTFSFLPLVMGSQDEDTCLALASALHEITQGKNVLIVGSSDLSHFHRYETAVKMDHRVVHHLESMDAEALLDDLEDGECEACGGGPMSVTMMVSKMRGADHAKLLRYANSGDVTGDRRSVVGYAAAVFYDGGAKDAKEHGSAESGNKKLTTAERRRLLSLARESIASRFDRGNLPKIHHPTRSLAGKRGAFVTLKKEDRLRGCIGFIEARKPLVETVRDMAQAAAFDDPRFPPLRADELDEVTIEISVLTPLKRVEDVNDIIIGVHGLYIVSGFHAGLLLPQVATEQGWDRTTFLEETCRKAGISRDAWKGDDITVYCFSADVFGEDE